MPAPLRLPLRPRLRARATRIALACLLGLALAFYLLSIRQQALCPERSDFAKFYASARFLWEGNSIYSPVPASYLASDAAEIGDASLHANLNPPFQTVLLAPLALLPYATAFTLWALIGLGCGVLAVLAISRRLGFWRPGQLMTALLVLLLNYGAWLNTAAGQFAMVLLLALALGSPQNDPRRERIAGLAIGIAMSLKVFVAAFVIALAVQRRWRALGWALAAALSCALIGGLGAGFHSYGDYFSVLGGVTWLADGRNASISGSMARIGAGAEAGTSSPQSGWPALVGQILAAAILAGTALAAWRTRASRAGQTACYNAMVPAMLLASPLGWVYYFPALTLPLLCLWRQANMSEWAWARLPIALGWFLTMAIVTKDSPIELTILPTVGMLVLWAMSLGAAIWPVKRGERTIRAQ